VLEAEFSTAGEAKAVEATVKKVAQAAGVGLDPPVAGIIAPTGRCGSQADGDTAIAKQCQAYSLLLVLGLREQVFEARAVLLSSALHKSPRRMAITLGVN
jgi:hypothetical protein